MNPRVPDESPASRAYIAGGRVLWLCVSLCSEWFSQAIRADEVALRAAIKEQAQGLIESGRFDEFDRQASVYRRSGERGSCITRLPWATVCVALRHGSLGVAWYRVDLSAASSVVKAMSVTAVTIGGEG
jgi:hypothetical protein